jgi:hypothetical protein
VVVAFKPRSTRDLDNGPLTRNITIKPVKSLDEELRRDGIKMIAPHRTSITSGGRRRHLDNREGFHQAFYLDRLEKPLSGDGEDAVCVSGHRHGHRSRSLLGSFGQLEIEVPRARLNTPDGKTTEWKSQALRAYQRRTLVADALIAGTYLAGTNTRRVRRALGALFNGASPQPTV